MKKTIALLMILLMILPLAVSCKAERFSLLYSTEADGITYCVRGNGNRPKQILAKRGDKILWVSKVSVARNLGDLGGNYGLEILDFNFDSRPDVMIPTTANGECVSYACWIQNEDGSGYTYSEELSSLCNPKTDAELLAVFGFSKTSLKKTDKNGVDYMAPTDTTTKYVWREGNLQPQIRVSLTHYPPESKYCYSVSYYDEKTGEFNDPDDYWLTPEEYESTDFSFIYYFR